MKKTFDSKWVTSWDLDDKGDWVLDHHKEGYAPEKKAWHLERYPLDAKEGKVHFSFNTKKEALTFHSLFLFAEHVAKERTYWTS